MRPVIFAILLLTAFSVNAQILEVGPFVGGSNVIGDVGSENFIRPNSLAFGGVGKWNVSTRYSYRFSVIYSKLQGNDADASSSARQQRGFSFTNKVLETSLGMEFNFLDFNLHELNKATTPYLYGGVSALFMEDLYFMNGEDIHSGNKTTFAIPMAVGVKTRIGTSLVLAGEIGARYTFSDNLDGSNPPGDDRSLEFGNVYSDDWYVFSGIILTYTFVKKPCQSCFD
ncbi:DUF6089 family protein [Robertkochia solimangrovi]|uniref:type IX secretion system protein PorG n=1 Tax=Robertkochia solimangrovi TaxID=2213046 RepID=UPI00117FBAA1|nr:DUF6089 family protein [Robertkochia solimangrovi]TRZ44421.1 hypothetical protein DMZ48_07910 [Robertkochia solimangrovi]